ncbi:MAG TPA: amino acid ABC transporter substrate-binding protein [Candidatus Butyricicoccus stercorigallinarum]|nr:amino acid ABC transporter substrate-binding protein [Candidatus Butyricicoccus stercorigallinarum]
MNFRRLMAMAAAAAMSVCLLAGCGGSNSGGSDNDSTPAGSGSGSGGADQSLQYVLDKGELVLGLDDSFPPMGYRDDNNEIVGFDIDVATAVCEKLGVELVTQPVDWDSKELELNAKNIDCIWNGLSVSEERLESMNMSIPYMENHMALVVRPDDSVTSIEDMEGKILAVQSGSTAEEALESEDGAALNDIIANVNGFDDNLTALMDLDTRASDAVLMDDVVANYLIEQNNKGYVVLSDFLYAEDYAIAFRKGDDALTEAVNEALRELKEDGTLAEISTKWFGSDKTTVE